MAKLQASFVQKGFRRKSIDSYLVNCILLDEYALNGNCDKSNKYKFYAIKLKNTFSHVNQCIQINVALVPTYTKCV